MSVLVIAEPGCTAEGVLGAMMRLIRAAKDAGADIWKPQWVSSVKKMLTRRHITPEHPKYEYYQRAYSWLNWPVGWHSFLAGECERVGLQYACTVFLPEDAHIVAHFADYLKVSSFENNDTELVAAAIAVKRTIVSCGMGKRWVDTSTFNQSMSPWALLHCVSAYPAPFSAMNLASVRDVSGLSDHSRNVLTGAVAVGAGARIIETHYRLDDCDPENPDYPVAFTPAELATYISNIRLAEIMMGTEDKTIQPCEEWGLPYRVGV